MEHISATFEFLYPRMTKNGVYLVEDLCCAYWNEFGGGLGRDISFIEKCKQMVDKLNAEHTRGALETDHFSKSTLSMHFYNSMVAFEKGTPADFKPQKHGKAPGLRGLIS
jgi:hypothetical protein